MPLSEGINPSSITSLTSQGRRKIAPTNRASINTAPITHPRTGYNSGSRRMNMPRSNDFFARASSSSISLRAVLPRPGGAIFYPHQITINGVVRSEHLVRTLRNNFSVRKHRNAVSEQDGRQFTGNDHQADAAAMCLFKVADVVENSALGCCVESTGSVVQAEDGRLAEQRTCKTDTLPLPVAPTTARISPAFIASEQCDRIGLP